MKTIHKYEVPSHGGIVRMPADARILSTGCQGLKLFIWAAVNIDYPMREFDIVVMGTGWNFADVNPCGRFIGTTQNDQGLVWHVFEGL